MHQLLHLDSSARSGSFSRELGGLFAAKWRDAHPDGRYRHRDLTRDPVPLVGEAWTTLCDTLLAEQITDPAQFSRAVRTPEEREAWAIVEPLLTELVESDVVLVGAPMYNFGVPAALKAWIDQVTFPRMSLAGTAFVVVGARGGSYVEGAPRAPYDYHERYLRDFFDGHFGVEDVRFVHTELTNARVDPLLADLLDAHEASRAQARAEVVTLADGVRAG
ncbi:FMN-dependent NADH-azoreductase [Mumia zhuanghuii]|uniref:FMN dependent NADH:quinone oxidoreductase n=1 Tax=Mumia zhuanghuii TaxID=2585211 RepID=A0A5C4MFC0_9ACTN|nr:NAD(P)H-dependent oxidoreductase [Mumia zhuanghuii]TNC42519.1 FMN-dependent NADH-azoreductase [Mumia zhuanghuii]TNC42547.1 FMN-dependent NADH-azoreductase [Mumia zhuanghuii]